MSENVTEFVRIIANWLSGTFYRSFVYSQFRYRPSCIVIAKTLQKARARARGINFAKNPGYRNCEKLQTQTWISCEGESNGGGAGVISDEKGDPRREEVGNVRYFGITDGAGEYWQMLLDGKYPRLEGRFYPWCNAIWSHARKPHDWAKPQTSHVYGLCGADIHTACISLIIAGT